MNIRRYNKDHLKENAEVKASLIKFPRAPESDDPLIFWTLHELEPTQVNLHPFATGQEGSNDKRFVPYSGRPELILQLASAIKENLIPARKKSVGACLQSLRAWWRVLDAVEAASEKTGERIPRTDDVRKLTMVHCQYAYQVRMERPMFTTFRAIADATRIALGARPLYWQAPKTGSPIHHQPPEEQVKVLRLALKRQCRAILDRWALADRLEKYDTSPVAPEEAEVYRHVQHMQAMQKKYNKTLPTPDELRCGLSQHGFTKKTGLRMKRLRETKFPSRWDADAFYHLCLCNTGWNPSTLQALDATKNFLFSHPKDDFTGPHKRFVLMPETYLLAGNKARAGDKEQIVIGLWKTALGPGHLIKTYMERVSPLRTLLNARLEDEKYRYAQLIRDGAEYIDRSTQYELVQRLEQGCRSVWLYVDKYAKIAWLGAKQRDGQTNDEGKKVSYLTVILERLNALRAERDEPRIPHVTQSDFRDFFATFVFKSSGGNILAVKRALGHAHLRTSTEYLNNNVVNKDSDDKARRFLEILMSELGKGRLDLTILSYQHRHGVVTQAMEERLAEYRVLVRSRINVACKDPYNPPPQIRNSGNGACDDNRCLLCPQNAVLLPESYDGIAMRVEELLALQMNLPIEAWISANFPIELDNNLAALQLFDLNLVRDSRQKWRDAIANGRHYVPGVPLVFDDKDDL